MPFSIVITREGVSDAVTAVPSNWVRDNCLFWPKTNKKIEQECLRSNGDSKPDRHWRKQKCRIKVENILTFEEALLQEERYANFDDTEEELMYLHGHEPKKLKYHDPIDFNNEFEAVQVVSSVKIVSDVVMCEPSTSTSEQNNSVQQNIEISNIDNQQNTDLSTINIPTNMKTSAINTDAIQDDDSNNAHADINVSAINTDTTQDDNSNNMDKSAINKDTRHDDDNCVTKICSDDQEMIMYLTTEHNKLFEENQTLKEIANNFRKYHEDVEHRFSMIQVRLDKIINLLETKTMEAPARVDLNPEDDVTDIDLKFPIESITDLMTLEKNLQDKDFETKLVKKFSKIFGTSGFQKLHKIGLNLISHIINDECLHLCTWKGIKGCDKIPFANFLRVREMINKIVCLADKTCSFKEVDAFLQHSAIKHSNQRLKRKPSTSATRMSQRPATEEIEPS